MRRRHCNTKRLSALLFLHSASRGINAFLAPTSMTHGRPSRHASLTPLQYLTGDEEPEQEPIIGNNNNKENHPPKKNTKPRRTLLHQLDRLLTELQMTQSHIRHHPFLSGNYAPVDRENFEVDVTVVEGEIPRGIWGAFCRNGPNPPRREGMRKRYHWFDGREYI